MLLQPRRRWATPVRFAQALAARRSRRLGKPPVWWHLMGTAVLALASTGGLVALSRSGADRARPQAAHLMANPIGPSQAQMSAPAHGEGGPKAASAAPRLLPPPNAGEPAPLPRAAPAPSRPSDEPAPKTLANEAARRQESVAGASGASADAKPVPKTSLNNEQSVRSPLLVPAEAPTGCLPEALRAVLADVAKRFGPVNVVSTHRLNTRNHAAGSARHKLHEACKAVDFRLPGERVEAVKAYLRSQPEVGGVETYRDGVVHVDVSETWTAGQNRSPQPGRRAKSSFADETTRAAE